tara:strand:- start:1452 stop:2186 length:735 start_codon:yes stop_codon:yes gene_type:complete
MDVYEALDLTEGERKVYKSLIELGDTTTGPLYKKSSVSQSKVYEILDRLSKKGLVTSIIKSGKKHWHAANPSIYLKKLENNLELTKKKKEILERALPKLIKKETEAKEETQIFEGYHGFRTALFSFVESLPKNSEFLVFGSPKPIPEPFYSFLVAFNKDRIKKNIRAKFLYGETLKSFAKKLYKTPKTKLKFIKSMTPASLAIGKDRIIIFDFDNKGKTIVILSKKMAQNFKIFFESLWKIARN